MAEWEGGGLKRETEESKCKRKRGREKLKSEQYLYLLDGEVKEGESVAHTDERLGSGASHACAQSSIQLQHHQFVEHVLDERRRRLTDQFIVWLHLTHTTWLSG